MPTLELEMSYEARQVFCKRHCQVQQASLLCFNHTSFHLARLGIIAQYWASEFFPIVANRFTTFFMFLLRLLLFFLHLDSLSGICLLSSSCPAIMGIGRQDSITELIAKLRFIVFSAQLANCCMWDNIQKGAVRFATGLYLFRCSCL
jgi:hypothetical protein